ncbi:hypothetical protein AB1Y20_023487 [Prymnesium parvum]|uniref:Uncharacterized protein n=1 Tax=Prymnesium parvum TaxID=97485 RepID=A0AB34JGZ9_PRYPA
MLGVQLLAMGCGSSKDASTPATPSPAPTATSAQEAHDAQSADALLLQAAAEADDALLAEGDEPSHRWAMSFDGGSSFHCGDEADALPPGSKRHAAEAAAFRAVQAVDRYRPPRAASYAVRLGWLVHDFLPTVPQAMLTHQVVSELIKPATRRTRARFVETLPSDAVGRVDVFVSHTWGAPFRELCAAVRHAVGDESAFVWIDIFAVRQWPGNAADVDFRPTVEAAKGFLLVGSDVTALRVIHPKMVLDGKLHTYEKQPDAVLKIENSKFEFENGLPKEALSRCAFFRVWCVVELVAALRQGKPTVLMIGKTEKDGTFEPNGQKHRSYKDTKKITPLGGMLETLYEMVDVRKATAKVEADRQRELESVASGPGFEVTNLYARGAILGAMWSMGVPEVLRAALAGDVELDVEKLSTRNRRCEALLAAVALGLERVTRQLLLHGGEGGAPLDLTTTLFKVGGDAAELDMEGSCYKHTPLGGKALELAALGGHVKVLKLLFEQGTPSPAELQVGIIPKEDPNQPRKSHPEPATAFALREAVRHGHLAAAEVLLDNGAPIDARAPPNQHDPQNGKTALVHAARYGQTEVVKMLLRRGASPDIPDTYSAKKCEPNNTPLHYAAEHAHADAAEALLAAGANPRITAHDHQMPLHVAARSGSLPVVKLLLKFNAHPEDKAKYAGTAIEVAEMRGHGDVLELLLLSINTPAEEAAARASAANAKFDH